MSSNDLRLDRILWYCYYFLTIFIPLLTLFMAISLGKGESYELESSYNLLIIPTEYSTMTEPPILQHRATIIPLARAMSSTN